MVTIASHDRMSDESKEPLPMTPNKTGMLRVQKRLIPMRSDSSSGDDITSIDDRDRQKMVQPALIWREKKESATNADGKPKAEILVTCC
ncbi:hypothetical protein DD238_000235 [Peronospora effusa]|uniref:Uncharacterized protein n=1 Tax=Peronospora effusa TaxID=542832 RepID=A0A3M6VVT2_9STRA|nr:hypothetical protein DD238_000235 [Peronospora effusa]RQM09033.1 hypothetical protein DD237_000507 [Peronospora effusa]